MAQNTVQKTGATYAGNFIMQANAPLDDRIVVASKDKLLEFNDYVYNGMLVVTLDENEVYQLVDKTLKSASDYSGWKKVGDDSSKVEELTEELIKDEEVIAQAINLLNALIQEHQELLDRHSLLLEDQLIHYSTTVTSGQSTTITKETHSCGDYPDVTVYYKGSVVFADVSVNSGNITVSWTPTATSQYPVIINIIGK